jgi:hypothetical protein
VRIDARHRPSRASNRSRRAGGGAVGSRVFRDGFTNTRSVLASAIPSAGIGDRGSCFGLPGLGYAPGGEVDCGVKIAIGSVAVGAREHPLGQREMAIDRPALTTPSARWVPAVGYGDLTVPPTLLITQLSGELSPASIGDGSSEVVIAQHARDVEVFEDESVVCLDQLVRDLMQEVLPDVANTVVMPAEPNGGLLSVLGSFLLARQRFRQAALLAYALRKRLRLIVDARDLAPIGGGGDDQCRQASVDTYPTASIIGSTRTVPMVGVYVLGLDIEAEPPAVPPAADSGEKNLRPVFGNEPSQLTGVVVNPESTDARQGHRPRMLLADPDRLASSLASFVAQPKRLRALRLRLEARKPNLPSARFLGTRFRPSGQGAPTIHRGFLEHLLIHLMTPSQSGRPNLGDASSVHGEYPSGGFARLPRIEVVDQVKARPRYVRFRIAPTVVKCCLDRSQALIKGKPGSACVPAQPLVLSVRQVQAVLKRRMPAHLGHSVTQRTDKPSSTPGPDGRRTHYRLPSSTAGALAHAAESTSIAREVHQRPRPSCPAVPQIGPVSVLFNTR